MANYRNKKLLEIVRKSPCQNCGSQDGSVCAAHSNQSKHGKGMGIKASDAAIAALCAACHHQVDQGLHLSRAERLELWNEAHAKTLRWLIENDYLILS